MKSKLFYIAFITLLLGSIWLATRAKADPDPVPVKLTAQHAQQAIDLAGFRIERDVEAGVWRFHWNEVCGWDFYPQVYINHAFKKKWMRIRPVEPLNFSDHRHVSNIRLVNRDFYMFRLAVSRSRVPCD